jgi:hypothetical protein
MKTRTTGVMLLAAMLVALLPGMPSADRGDRDKQPNARRLDREKQADGCQGHPDVDRPERGEPAAHLRFTGVYRNQRTEHGNHLSSQNLAAVKMNVKWKHLPQGGTQRIEVFTPNGDLYRAFTARVNHDTPSETLLTVTGWITDHSLWGKWCVEVFLNGEGDGPVLRHRLTLVPAR